MSNLYEITGKLKKIHDELETTGGLLTVELEKMLDDCTLAFKDKAENIGRWMLNIDGKVESLDKEIIRLAERKKAAENLKNRLKEYVKVSMEAAEIDKLDFPTFTLAIQKNPPSVEIWNEKAIPARFITIVPEQKQIDKKAVLAALKAGEKIEGATLLNEKTHLRQR